MRGNLEKENRISRKLVKGTAIDCRNRYSRQSKYIVYVENYIKGYERIKDP